MSSKEKICLHERDRHLPLPSGPAEDEEEEAAQTAAPGQAKASSSSSSEEESESESDAESGEGRRRNPDCVFWAAQSLIGLLVEMLAEKAKNRELINNLNNKRNTSSLLPTSMSTGSAATASQVKKVTICHGTAGSTRCSHSGPLGTLRFPALDKQRSRCGAWSAGFPSGGGGREGGRAGATISLTKQG